MRDKFLSVAKFVMQCGILLLVAFIAWLVIDMVWLSQEKSEQTFTTQAVANWGGGEQLVYGLSETSSVPVAMRVAESGAIIQAENVRGIIDTYIIKSTGTFTVTASVTNTSVFTVQAGHTLTTAESIFFRDPTIPTYQQVKVLVAAGNVITVDTPLDRAWLGTFAEGDLDMTVDGSSTAAVYALGPSSPTIVDITRIIVHIEDDSAMDTAKFGGLLALTNGVVVRVNRNGYYQTILNVKTNGEWAQRAYDVSYSDKAPAGTFGLAVRRSFGGEDKNGTPIRLNGALGESIEVLIQDDLTGLTGFGIVLQGHLTN